MPPLPPKADSRTLRHFHVGQQTVTLLAIGAGDEMKFIYMDDLSKVEKGYANIPEPIADGPVADDPTALVLMPGLAFDPQGHRCGYGGGFYDKFLSAEPNHPTLALCYEFQMLPHLETEDHDIPVDYVIWA